MIKIEELLKSTKKFTLLYVEDNEDAREATLFILEDIFDNIIVAVDGSDGLNKFKENDIDIVLTDISMPIMDGLEMCQNIKQIDPDQPIIVLTALLDINTLKKAIDIGVDSFINKPLEDITILFEKLSQVVKRINYDKQQEEIIEARINQEKVNMMLKLINDILHHWKQPLSVISTISTTYSFKLENNIDFSTNDYKMVANITDEIKKISDILTKIEKLDFTKITTKEIEDIIYISNPIYNA